MDKGFVPQGIYLFYSLENWFYEVMSTEKDDQCFQWIYELLSLV